MHPIFFSMVIELSRQPFDRNSNRQVECPEARISKPETCTPCHLPNSQKSPPQDSSAHKNKHKKVRIWAEDMVSSLYALTQIQSKCRNTPVGHPARGCSGRPSQYMQPSDPAVDSRASLITMLLCRTESPQGLPDLIFSIHPVSEPDQGVSDRPDPGPEEMPPMRSQPGGGVSGQPGQGDHG